MRTARWCCAAGALSAQTQALIDGLGACSVPSRQRHRGGKHRSAPAWAGNCSTPASPRWGWSASPGIRPLHQLSLHASTPFCPALASATDVADHQVCFAGGLLSACRSTASSPCPADGRAATSVQRHLWWSSTDRERSARPGGALARTRWMMAVAVTLNPLGLHTLTNPCCLARPDFLRWAAP